MHYFGWAYIITILGLMAAFALGWAYTHTLAGAGTFLLIGAILAVLEISLSFDNAIVNANTLKDMDPKWQRRFLTWGILIAVFGMRIIFPLAVVSIAASVGPIEAIKMAIVAPHEYALRMNEAHLSIAAFGGTFLMMVALNFFINREKDIHWISFVEHYLQRCAAIRGFSIILVLIIATGVTLYLDSAEQRTFLIAAVAGLAVFIFVESMSRLLDSAGQSGDAIRSGARSGGLGAFLYLEVLDSSFSFDGVIGAFAITQNLFLIAIGLGIGAMYVRSMTIMIVEKKTLAQFRFIEHGAFYSILALSFIMFAQSIFHIPELVTGLVGATLIGLSLLSSIKFNRLNKEAQ